MAKQPLLINAFDLLRRPGTEKLFELTVHPSTISLDDERLDPDADIAVSLRLESLPDGVVVTGHLTVPWHGLCRRCATPVEGVAESEVDEQYQITVTNPDAFQLVGDQLDLVEMIRENLLLDVPATPLCREDCAGLCLVCGIDRNAGTCECVIEAVDPRWAGLADFDPDQPGS